MEMMAGIGNILLTMNLQMLDVVIIILRIMMLLNGDLTNLLGNNE